MTDRVETTSVSADAVPLERALAALTRAQQHVLSNEARYQAIIENAVDAIITIDEDGTVESVNPSAVRLFEYSETELVGQNVSLLVPSPDRERHDEYIRRYLATGNARIIGIGRDVEGVKKSGERFPMRLSIGQSELDGRHFFTGIIQDLSERKRYAESIRLMSAIVESSNDAIIALTLDGVVSSWNGSAERLCGIRAQEMIGQRWTAFVPREHREQMSDLRDRTQRGDCVTGAEMRWRRNDGTSVDVEVNLAPIHGAEGDIVGISVTAHDLTRQKQAERELEDRAERMEFMNEELQRRRDEADSQRSELERINGRLLIAMRDAKAAAEAKTQFVANMSHEIRTPMAAILGYISELGELPWESDSEAAEAVESIRRNGEHLLALIDDILDFSKLEAGRLRLKRTRFSPDRVVRDRLAQLETRAARKGISIQIDSQVDAAVTIESDVERFRQILDNLLDNALKFTEVGSVCVGLKMVKGEGGPLLEVCVSDTGVGFDSADAGDLFQPFSQADSSMTRAFGGTGLGLSICGRLVALLDGTIDARSRRGLGSEFRFTIAAGPRGGGSGSVEKNAPASVASNDASLEGRHILLVEDGVDNQRLFKRFLTKAGAQVDVAVNGSDAVVFMNNGRETGHVPDLVVMDMQMPVMDGYEATRRLRASNFSLPIVALTAHAMEHDRARCLDAGCDDYLAKPVDRKALIATLCRWLEPRRGAASDPTVAEQTTLPS